MLLCRMKDFGNMQVDLFSIIDNNYSEIAITYC